MKKILYNILFLIPVLGLAQEHRVIPASMYSWKNPIEKIEKNILTTKLFEGSAYDMDYLQMSANALLPSNKKSSLQVPGNEEHLLIIKSGTLNIFFKDSSWSIGPGSIALLMPNEKYSLQNETADSTHYFLMSYRSKLPIEPRRGKNSGGSFVKDWNNLEFKAHEKGGVRRYFTKATAMSKRFEMHVTTLKEGMKSHEPHTHRAEEILLMIENKTEMQIGDKFYKGGEGTVYYVGSNIPHAIRNDGSGQCTYFAFQFE